jgi:RNA polymerase sigma factor for flagellar operon FliA
MAENGACVQVLWQRYAAHKSITDKNRLVVYYLSAVKKAARQLMPACRGCCSFEDMVGNGVIGLMDAIEKYDATQGARFETYGALRIRGEMLDGIRAQDWASDSLRRRLRAAEKTRSALRQSLGREPETSEIAAQMNISEAALQNALEKNHAFSTVYLEDITQDEAWEELISDGASSPEKIVEDGEIAEALENAISRLPEKERLVISLYYFEEMTQKKIAMKLGVTEARICQIRAAALGRLKGCMRRFLQAESIH